MPDNNMVYNVLYTYTFHTVLSIVVVVCRTPPSLLTVLVKLLSKPRGN